MLFDLQLLWKIISSSDIPQWDNNRASLRQTCADNPGLAFNQITGLTPWKGCEKVLQILICFAVDVAIQLKHVPCKLLLNKQKPQFLFLFVKIFFFNSCPSDF